MHAGRDEDRQERRRAGSVRLRLAALLGLALGWPQPAGAALGAPEEALTTFEILRPTDLDPALAEELRQAPSERALRQGVVDLPAQATRTVTISWTAKERPGLEGYRLTALIDGGPLSGLAGRWHVTAAGSDGSGTARTYRVRWLRPGRSPARAGRHRGPRGRRRRPPAGGAPGRRVAARRRSRDSPCDRAQAGERGLSFQVDPRRSPPGHPRRAGPSPAADAATERRSGHRPTCPARHGAAVAGPAHGSRAGCLRLVGVRPFSLPNRGVSPCPT